MKKYENFEYFWLKNFGSDFFLNCFQHLIAVELSYKSRHFGRPPSSPWVKFFESDLVRSRPKFLNRLEKNCLQLPPIFKHAHLLEEGLNYWEQHSKKWRNLENGKNNEFSSKNHKKTYSINKLSHNRSDAGTRQPQLIRVNVRILL